MNHYACTAPGDVALIHVMASGSPILPGWLSFSPGKRTMCDLPVRAVVDDIFAPHESTCPVCLRRWETRQT